MKGSQPMKLSLLFANGNKSISINTDSSVIREAIYNLNIDRAITDACGNTTATDYFLSVLSAPLTVTDDVAYRQEILRDLSAEPRLLDSLMLTFKGYDNLREENEELSGGIFRYGSSQSSTVLLDCAYERAYISAHFARNVIAYIAETNAVMNGYSPKSRGLTALKEFCARVTADPLIGEAERGAELFRNETPENYRFDIKLVYDRMLRVSSCELISLSEKKKEKFNPLSALKIKKKEAIPSSVEIGSSAAETSEIAVASALEALADMYDALAEGLFETLYGMSDELKFYSVAAGLERYIKGSGMSVCYPSVLPAEDNAFSASGLYDLLLLSEGKNSTDIVKNEISVSKNVNGILVRGDNNCGKTSFLRAVGCAQIFAQAGLFVCADSFTASVRQGIFTHFSSAEKDFSENDAAGRFEGEVKDVARIIERLRPYSLVMLNETFQTTAYSEGAEGIKAVLDALPILSVKFIFVTHMLSVFNLFDADGAQSVNMLKTGENSEKYRLVPFRNGI